MKIRMHDVLRRYGKLSVSHKRNVNVLTCAGEQGKFYKDLSGNFIRDDDLPDVISVKEFKLSKWSKTAHINDFISKCGGYCSVEFELHGKTYYSSSDCCGLDRYVKSIGLNIAIGRLVSRLDKTILKDIKQCSK